MLGQDHSHTVVHDEQTGFNQPNCEDLHLLYHQDELGTIDTRLDLGFGVLGDIVARGYQVATGFGDLIHEDHEHGICGLNSQFSVCTCSRAMGSEPWQRGSSSHPVAGASMIRDAAFAKLGGQ